VRFLPGVGLLAAAVAFTCFPPTRAADDKAAAKPAPVDQLVRDLSDPSSAVREKATRELWQRGREAIPALQKAARGPDPEAARRARGVLDTFAWNIYPDTPAEVVKQIRKFQAGWPPEDGQEVRTDNGLSREEQLTPRGEWPAAVLALLDLGEPGRAAVRAFLARGLPAPAQARLVHFISVHCRKQVPVLLLEGKPDAAAALMALHAGGTTPEGAADYAAFLYLRGNLPAAIAEAEAALKRGADPATARLVLAHLYRATGDWAKARAAAANFPRPDNGSSIAEMLLEEQGDWAALADAGPQLGRVNHPEALELTMLRLAGRKKEFDDLAKATYEAARGPGARKDAVVALLFNFRTEEAVELLRTGKQELGLLAEIEINRLRYKVALELAAGKDDGMGGVVDGLGGRGDPREVIEFDIRRARTLALLGKRDDAAVLFSETAAALRRRGTGRINVNDLERIARSLLRSELRAGLRDLAADHAGQFLTEGGALSRAATTGETVFEILFGSDAPAAEGLYHALRRDDSAAKKPLVRVRELLAGTAPKEDVEAALRALAADPDGPDTVRPGLRPGSTAAPRNQRVNWLLARAAVHRGAKQYAEAEAALEKAAAEATPASGEDGPRSWAFGTSDASGPWVELVDFLYDRGRFADAAAKAEAGWRKFPDRPLLLFLSGKAKLKAGDGDEGRRRMDLSHWVSLGNERVRGKFLDELVRRGEAAAAKRETELLLKACWPRDHYFGNVMNQAARAAVLNKDFPLAELCVQRSLLTLMRTPYVYFVESAAYFTVPHDMRIYRARGLLAAGKVDEAVAAARDCQTVTPGHVGLVSGMVPELDKLGRKADADALYGTAAAAYRKVLADYPDGPSARNSLAILAANCRRDLDAALKCAEEAVKAVPDSDGYRETLAEVHFRRGDRDKAVAVMTKLLEEYPRTRLYHRQLQRYKTGGLDSPMPDAEDD
jgi:tetratricopeptide (TPR) repeat protein